MKKDSFLMIFILLFLGLILGCSSDNPVNPVDRHGHLSVQGRYLMDESGRPVTLRGYGLFWHQWEPGTPYYNRDCVAWLQKDFKVTVVRPWIGVELGDGYIKNPELAYSCCDSVVQACVDLGLYVIIDFHSYDAASYTDEAVTFFARMSRKWGGYANVLFEAWNEPKKVEWASVIKPYHEKIVKVIRENDPDEYENVIILGTRFWSQNVDEPADDPVIGENLMYTVHFYCDDAWHQQRLMDIVQYALDRETAVFCTEFGFTAPSGDGPLNYEWGKKWLDFMEANQISWTPMTIGNKYESMCAIQTDTTKYRGGWNPDVDLKESGQFFRTLLREKNASEYGLGNQ